MTPSEIFASRTLWVVPSHDHVAQVMRANPRDAVQTRSQLRERLARALIPELRVFDPAECRLVLAAALEASSSDLLRADAGVSKAKKVAALDASLAWLRAREITAEHLDAVADGRHGGENGALVSVTHTTPLAHRARTLAAAMREMDRALDACNAMDGRALGIAVARAIRRSEVASLVRSLGSREIRARWVTHWDAPDLAWWRALDEALSTHAGGSARVMLPAFERPLAATRKLDGLEMLAEYISRELDAPTENDDVDLSLSVLVPVETDEHDDVVGPGLRHVTVVAAADAQAQAEIVANEVSLALENNVSIDRVAVAYAGDDEAALAALRKALDERGVVVDDAAARSKVAVTTPVIAAAMLALNAADSLDRRSVAKLLASGWVDATCTRIKGQTEREAEALWERIALALMANPTAAGADPVERWVRTVVGSRVRGASRKPEAQRESESAIGAPQETSENITSDASGDADSAEATALHAEQEQAMLRAVGAWLVEAGAARTRRQRVQAARTLWGRLGMGTQANRSMPRVFGHDASPGSLARAQRRAIARNQRAWTALTIALDRYESVVALSGASDHVIDAATFQAEILDGLGSLGASSRMPGAGASDVGALRVAPLARVAGQELESLIVINMNHGVFPRGGARDAWVSEPLAEALGEVCVARRNSDRSGGLQRLHDAYGSHAGVVAGGATPMQGQADVASLVVATAAAKRVVFTYCREDGAGTPLERSAVIPAGFVPGQPPEAWLSTTPTKTTRDPGELAAALTAEERIRLQREQERESFFFNPMRPRSGVVGALHLADANRQTEGMRAILTHETGGGRRALAVTSLERFARCSFMGFAHVVLGTRDVEVRGDLPDHREEGSVIHEALAAAFSQTRAAWRQRPRPEAEAIVTEGLSAADAVLDRWQGFAPLRALVRLRVRDAVRRVLEASVADEEWDFFAAEQSFGFADASSWPPLVVRDSEHHEGETLRLRGSMDRVDLAHDGGMLRVVDYKKSKSSADAGTRALGETALQVPLYARVASQQLGVAATGLYLPTYSRDARAMSKSSARAADQVTELAQAREGGLSPIEQRALTLIQGIRRGNVAPLPADESTCLSCSVSGGCRKPRFMIAASESSGDEPNAPV